MDKKMKKDMPEMEKGMSEKFPMRAKKMEAMKKRMAKECK